MHCIACGEPVQENTRFCLHGGVPLRAAQADPDVKTVNGRTVLMIASGAGRGAVVRLLLKVGVRK